MKEEIVKIQNEINRKKSELVQKVGDSISSIDIYTIGMPKRAESSNKNYLPPLFWSVSAISLLASILAERNNVFYAVMCVGTGIGAFVAGNIKRKQTDNNNKISFTDLESLSPRVVKVIRDVCEEWDNFIEQKKQKVQSIIDNLNEDENKKEQLLFYTYVTEPIDMKAADVYLKMNKIKHSQDIATDFEKMKHELIKETSESIEKATHRQIKKYNSILDLL